MLGGAATYFSIAASILYQPIHLVGVVGSDFPAEVIGMFEDRQIKCAGLSRSEGLTFRWKGYYEGDMDIAVTEETHLNVFGDFKPVLPESLKEPDYLFLANIDPEIQLDVLDQVKRPRTVAADTMNFWISSKPESLRRLMERVDIMVLNEGEALQLTETTNVVAAAQKVLEIGPKVVVIKKGADGALIASGSHLAVIPAFPLASVTDPTGAGDSFGGGMMAALAAADADHNDFAAIKRAAAHGSVIASFNCESFSMERMQQVTALEVSDRLEILRTIARF